MEGLKCGTNVWMNTCMYLCMHVCTLADPAVGFGGGQLGEVTQARVPPKLKTPRIWPTIFGEWPKSRTKIKYIKRKTKKVRLQVLAHHGSPWLVRWDPDSF